MIEKKIIQPSITLLYVDSNEHALKEFNKKLKAHIEKIYFEKNTQKALELFITNQPDVVVVDSSIAEDSGIDLIEQIRIMNKQVPIIFVTNFFQKEIIVTALKIGVNNFFEKPIEIDVLIDAIKDHAKLINLDKYVKEQKENELKTLKEIDQYKSYQENIAFQKELKILKQEVYK